MINFDINNSTFNIPAYRQAWHNSFLASTYMQYGYYNESRTKINQVTGTAMADVHAKQLMHTVCTAYENNYGTLELNANEEAIVRGASTCTAPVKINAQSVLRRMKMEEYRRVPKKHNVSSARGVNTDDGSDEPNASASAYETSQNSLPQNTNFSINPNPFTNSTIIEYEIANNSELIIYNSLGSIVYLENLNAENKQLQIESNEIGKAGIYYILISNNGNVLFKDKIIIIK